MSTEKLSQVTNLVRKKTTNLGYHQNRFANQKPNINDVQQMIVDEKEIILQETDTTMNCDRTKTLIRCETFTQDSTPNKNKGDTFVKEDAATEHFNQRKDQNTTMNLPRRIFNLEESNLFDTSEMLLDNTFADSIENNKFGETITMDPKNQASKSFDNDLTIVPSDHSITINKRTGKVLNSTMLQSNMLLDLTQTEISPARQLMNITHLLDETASPNTTKLLYMTNVDDSCDETLNATVIHCDLNEQFIADECMDVDDQISSVCQIGMYLKLI